MGFNIIFLYYLEILKLLLYIDFVGRILFGEFFKIIYMILLKKNIVKIKVCRVNV